MITENEPAPPTESPTTEVSKTVPASPKPPPHPFALAVATLFHSARDVEDCVGQYVPLAVERHNATLGELKEEATSLKARCAALDEREQGAAIRQLFDTVNHWERWANSNPGNTLRVGLLLRLFSAYDFFVGTFLRALFEKKSELFNKLGGEVKIANVLEAADLNAFKAGILTDYIDGFRRTSYSEQFGTLEKLSSISKLTAFPNYARFIEAGQRRNLFAHCGGVVSDQYLAKCRDAGHEAAANIKLGDTLTLDDAYVKRASRLVMEVALKLSQTLWRKLFPDELASADGELHRVAFQGLQLQEWEWAEMVCEFDCGLPRHSNERFQLLALVNRAIAAKQRGRADETTSLLGSEDWSAKASEFSLAVAVLLDRYDEAAAIMRRIGNKGEMVTGASYHLWPLFREFRGSPEFLDAYKDVFGYAFVQDLKPVASPLEEAAARMSNGALPPATDPQISEPVPSTEVQNRDT